MSFSIQKCRDNRSKCLILVADNTTPGEHPACAECSIPDEVGSHQQQENEDLGKVLIEKLTKEELTILCAAYDDGSIEAIFYDHLYPQDVRSYPKKYANDDSIQS